MATSGSFNTGSVGNFYFTFEWWRTGYDSSANEHYISYKITAHNTAGSYRTVYKKSLWINGANRYYAESGTKYYDGDVVATGDLTISSYNSSGDGRIEIEFYSGVGISSGDNCNGSDSWDLDRIPRYTTVWNSERGKTINTISVNWSTSDTRDWTQYSINDGAWQDAYDTIASDNKSGHYTIHNLQPNTTYKIRTRCRRADSGLWSEAGELWISTHDIAKLVSVPNIKHGDNLTVSYLNPSGQPIQIGIWRRTDVLEPLAGGYRDCTGASYTFNFTDKELDDFYKLYGKNHLITLSLYIKTTDSYDYYDYREFTITLTGNQKTIKVNNDSIWKRGKIWTNVEGMWKRAIIWNNVDGTWKKSI